MKKLFLAVIFFQLLLLSAYGISWEQALSLAQANNPELKSAAKQAESAQWSYYKSFSSFLPQLSASAALGQTASGTLAVTAKSSSYGLSVSQALFTGFDNYLSALSSKANYEYYLAAKQKEESDLYYKLRQTFVDLSIAEENINLYRKILERRKNNGDLIELRFDSGREDKGSLLRTQADAADAAFNITVSENARALAQLKLAQLISAEVSGAEGTLEAQLVTAPDFGKLLAASPAYQMGQKQVEKAELAYRKTGSELLPSVTLSGAYRNSGTDWPPTSSSNSWSLSFSYPFFSGGANIADRIISFVQYDQSRQDFIASSNDLRYGIEAACRNLSDAIEAVKIARLSLAAASLRAEIARTKYLNGLMNYDSWDIIENDYISAQKTLLAKKKAALYAEAAWHNSYGGYIK